MPFNEIYDAINDRIYIRLSKDDRYFTDKYQGIPLDGYTNMIEKMVDDSNIKIKLNTSFFDIEPKRYKYIFYTGSVDELMEYKFGHLPYRSVNFKLEEYRMTYYQNNAVVNYSDNYDFTRIHEFKYYINNSSNRTTIAKEYPEDFEIGKNERFYPVPLEENNKLHRHYIKAAKEKYPNIHFLGRLGDYKYYDMDKAVARAMNLFEEVFK